MLEFAIPTQISGIASVTLYGSLEVPVALEGESGPGDTPSGGTIDFDIVVGQRGMDLSDPDTWVNRVTLPCDLTVPGVYASYSGSTDVATGSAGSTRSLYVRYNNYQAYLTGGKSTCIYNVTLTNQPRYLSVTKQTKRGRFV